MSGKPSPFAYRSRIISRDPRDNSRHRSPNKSSNSNLKPFYGNSKFKPTIRNCSPYLRSSNYQNKLNYNTNNAYTNNSRPQSPYHNRDGNPSRRPFSRNRLTNVRNYINSLLDWEQTEDTNSNTENAETQNVSEEQLLEQQFNDVLLELYQDTQDDYFNCQKENNTLTEEHILSTSCKSNTWVLPLTMYKQQTLDYTKTVSPPHLEIVFF